MSWYCSPIQDILDKDEFTLEELLAEVDILQEVKSLNGKLIKLLDIDFGCTWCL